MANWSNNTVPIKRPLAVRFSTYTSEDIRKLSVKQITNVHTFDRLMNANHGGLCDPALGPIETLSPCSTCGQIMDYCPGHFGHIDLHLPVYHPLFFKHMLMLLKGMCFQCHHLHGTPAALNLFVCQLKLLEYGLLTKCYELPDIADAVANTLSSSEDMSFQQIQKGIIHAINAEVQHALANIPLQDKKNTSKWTYSKNVTQCRKLILHQFFHYCISHGSKKCNRCKGPPHIIRAQHHAKVFYKQRVKSIDQGKNTEMESEYSLARQKYMHPIEVRYHLRQLWKNEKRILTLVFGTFNKLTSNRRIANENSFFLDVIPVPPTRFRPVSTLGDSRFESPQTTNLNKILEDNVVVEDLIDNLKQEENKNVNDHDVKVKSYYFGGRSIKIAGSTPTARLHNAWLRLQTHVNCFVDSDLDKLSSDKAPGIKQILEKKEGLLRKHMMGKRVNFAARSVISPDLSINCDEVGVPEVFATKLTYCQPVTPFNVRQLRNAVINGPNKHPGATLIEFEDGNIKKISQHSFNQRQALAKQLLTPNTSHVGQCKKVHRHLVDGDVVLMNRQPTLHRPSIMAHKVRVLPGEKTLRLHYANCKCYNADFDGDEMNMHVPQSELSRAEAYTIASTKYQYLLPKDGKPISGLIQDHMVSSVKLMIRGRMFTKEQYFQLIYFALTDKDGPIHLLPPCIIKPRQLWSGKQVLSTLLLNILPKNSTPLNMLGKSKIADKSWVNTRMKKKSRYYKPLYDEILSESQVVIRQGELLCGILDKAHFGATSYGLVHCCYELYGGDTSTTFLSSVSKLLTKFLQMNGFTLGIEDILVRQDADNLRQQFIKDCASSGNKIAKEAFNVNSKSLVQEKFCQAHLKNKDLLAELESHMKRNTDHFTNEINKACTGAGLLKLFPENNLQLMVQSGAKGSTVNCMQISCLLGQIELEGKRPPLMISGRSLPSFTPYDTSPRAGGFVDNRFLSGLRPQEYFFHCMAGREGLVDTAVKTSRSGYLQRCLVKHLEGLVVQYDLTVRDTDGSVIQFQYGEDSVDVTNTQFLSTVHYPFMANNYISMLDKLDFKAVMESDFINRKKAVRSYKKLAKWFQKRNLKIDDLPPLRQLYSTSAVQEFEFSNLGQKIRKDYKSNVLDKTTGLSTATTAIINGWKKLDSSIKEKFCKSGSTCPDPVNCRLKPDRYFGSVSEKQWKELELFLAQYENGIPTSRNNDYVPCDNFRKMMHLKFMRALVEPGCPVGLLAAQSIGEPSTQMTLNTFHFAGRGEMNVTLGIPRLREILMVGSPNIKTPSMIVILKKNKDTDKNAKYLKKHFTRVTLSQVNSNFLFMLLLYHVYVYVLTCEFQRYYSVRMNLLPYKDYKDEFAIKPARVIKFIEDVFILHFIKSVEKVIKASKSNKVINLNKLGRFRKFRDVHDDAKEKSKESTQDEETTYDDQLTNNPNQLNHKSNKVKKLSYDDNTDDETEDSSSQSDDNDDGSELYSNQSQNSNEFSMHIFDCEITRNFGFCKRSNKFFHFFNLKTVSAIHQRIVANSHDVQNKRWYEFTFTVRLNTCKIILEPIIEQLAKQATIREVQSVKKCYINKDKNETVTLTTDGVNLQDTWQFANIIDVNKLYTNEIHAMASTYGIEAAYRAIIKEIENVFRVYGIDVNYRHLSLIADYMTYEGSYRPLNRLGMASCSSPFQKMSFETTVHFLREATAHGEIDVLKSPSSRLVTGRVVNGGTGCFDLVQPLSYG
ncbi:uncharacterized protein TRIADDRAFT_27970 [Trichoplax adhaerens]|uniref:DNA-directed RNA polymerase subunit n=1 Tax=Trichoplax adhaerens TaxID=10228 RepID=B3S2I6_TRIAD|nr:hypothetical protein TRIADDRAFT_27970 [Trichoplax adhaerens]EDV23428.1 hypothetical protein TRIADDRAFT_27970 [Trichoplax adhaerens]|eukprot:XP_002114338.1 hypothetical protein TRIADDRAFT_27970 [Trichoplax adhaerens]